MSSYRALFLAPRVAAMGRRFEKSDTPLGSQIEQWVKTQPVPRITTFVERLAPFVKEVRGRPVDLANLERDVRLWRRQGSLPPEYQAAVAEVLGIDIGLIEVAVSDRPKFARLRYVTSNIDLFRTLSTGEVACDMSVTFYNPNEFDLRFEATLDGWINEKVSDVGPTEIAGYIDPNSDLTLYHERLVDFPLTRTPKPRLPCVLALLDYEINYQPAFSRTKRARKEARVRFISWGWPFKDQAGESEFKTSGFLDNEVEE